MSKHYILKKKQPVRVDLTEWAAWFEKSDNRTVARTQIGDADVSTVFLGLDHNFSGGGPPLIFETLVFGGTYDGEMMRCSSWQQAEAAHKAMCERVAADSVAS